MKEPLPLARVQDAIMEFLRHRVDVVLFGAQAVNAYVDEPRMTQDVDIAALNGREVAEELRSYLAGLLHIATRVRDVREGLGFRVYQVRKEGNRHLADVRPVPYLPPMRDIDGIQVVSLEELIANKVLAMVARSEKAKGLMDRRDLFVLLAQHPELKTSLGPVRNRLSQLSAGPEVIAAWEELVAREITRDGDEDEF